ncbi:PPA1309 family protein [Prauserella halophila]|uniref:PPA1309 family protein n=1 Tax=Prauserella halophila TaxID=185641 RepID=A0ABN1W091_9PSEU|nr:PPA1309 family protein [Prauserella halophila]
MTDSEGAAHPVAENTEVTGLAGSNDDTAAENVWDFEDDEDLDDDGSASAAATVGAIAREVEEFVAAGGWQQPPQLFALVPTAELLSQQPELADSLDPDAELTPVAQEPLPGDDLADALATIAWPELVQGCALAQEIIVLPPDAEDELPGVDESAGVSATDVERLKQAAAGHPQRTEARLVAAVLRDGPASCAMRLHGIRTPPADDAEPTDEIIEHPELAPNLVEALRATLLP